MRRNILTKRRTIQKRLELNLLKKSMMKKKFKLDQKSPTNAKVVPQFPSLRGFNNRNKEMTLCRKTTTWNA